MNPLIALFVPLGVLFCVVFVASSVRVIDQGNEALVQRFGKYRRTLRPGINYITPFLDTIVVEDTVREQVVDIPIQKAITKDNVAIEVVAQVYWRVVNLEKAYYAIDNLGMAIENLVNTTLRAKLGQMKLEETFSATYDLNKALLRDLDGVTGTWGVKIVRVEVERLKVPQSLLDSMELEKAAEIKKRAAIAEAEGTIQSMKLLIKTLRENSETPLNMAEIMKFLVAQKYVEASQELSKSPNAKIIFMDPKALSEALSSLIETPPNPPTGTSSNGNHRGEG